MLGLSDKVFLGLALRENISRVRQAPDAVEQHDCHRLAIPVVVIHSSDPLPKINRAPPFLLLDFVV